METVRIAMRVAQGDVRQLKYPAYWIAGEWAVHKRVAWCDRKKGLVEAMDHTSPWCITLTTNGMRAHGARTGKDAIAFAMAAKAEFPEGYQAGNDAHRVRLSALKAGFR